jgi:hypothetical protein
MERGIKGVRLRNKLSCNKVKNYLVTYPPVPLPLIKGRGNVS